MNFRKDSRVAYSSHFKHWNVIDALGWFQQFPLNKYEYILFMYPIQEWGEGIGGGIWFERCEIDLEVCIKWGHIVDTFQVEKPEMCSNCICTFF